MKTEDKIRDKANKLIKEYFDGNHTNQEKIKREYAIRELIWVLDETLLVKPNGDAELIGNPDKKLNPKQKEILREIRKHKKGINKTDIYRNTGISSPVIKKYVDDFYERGWLSCNGKPEIYTINEGGILE